MRITGIDTTWLDYPDNESQAVIVYFSGCGHGCPGCQNKKYQNFENDESRQIEVHELIDLVSKACQKNRTNKVVFSGGDPFFPKNATEAALTIDQLRDHYSLDICVYTGYNIEDVIKIYEKPFLCTFTRPTFFKCGKYLENLKRDSWGKSDKDIRWVSTNQNLYDENFNLVSSDGIYTFKSEI